jgi:surface antigen
MMNTYKVNTKAEAKAIHSNDNGIYGATAFVEIAAIDVIKSEEENGIFTIVLPAVTVSEADARVLRRLFPKRLEAIYEILGEEMVLQALATAKR